MNILAIPGKMPATKAWLQSVLSGTTLSKQNIKCHQFIAWNNDQEFDVDSEANELPAGHYDLLITKSIGTLIALKSSKVTYDKLIFIGVALSLYSDKDKELLVSLKDKSISVLIIQENHDPFGFFDEIKSVMGKNNNIQCVEVTGEHHQYKNVEELSRIIDTWLH